MKTILSNKKKKGGSVRAPNFKMLKGIALRTA